jgi:hypothetical protein
LREMCVGFVRAAILAALDDPPEGLAELRGASALGARVAAATRPHSLADGIAPCPALISASPCAVTSFSIVISLHFRYRRVEEGQG